MSVLHDGLDLCGTSIFPLHPMSQKGHDHVLMLMCGVLLCSCCDVQDTLQDKWSPCHNICTVLMSIQSMLTDPNCSSPANPEAAQLYIKDRTAYNRSVAADGVCSHEPVHCYA